MADKLPPGPTAPARKKREPRSMYSDLSGAAQGPVVAEEPVEQESEVASPTDSQAGEAPAKKPAKKLAKKSAVGKAKGWDRSGQVAVVLGSERHARLKNVWKSNATTYDAIADLIREAIDEKLDQLEK
ncbi:hypothetical protein [Rhodococcus sp. IEGM 1408]|uniref:hypothetical protein n=1 Tax=Rhodococcus sp. IEGM 1408 TaxID=3082220 RepID=UPI002953FCAA|nr:hypothetical protein [Rhodococcus sp. IEGM 1408]MDV8002865.1 hypothetical protein [Rhodococcus sp. IEGM 1408]